MKSNEVGTTLKHPETINGNVKNLSKRMTFYFKNLILPLISILLASLTTFSALARLLLLCSPNPTLCLQNDALKLKKKGENRSLFPTCSCPKDIFDRSAILSRHLR
jgi:hypothetical protein